jgi:hypothetical protein
VAVRKPTSKQIHLEYCFDRLSAKKIMLAYKLLVPDKMRITGGASESPSKSDKRISHDDSCDLRKSLIGSSKRGTYDW